MEQFQVGIGREKITPPLGTLLHGYVPYRPALALHDDVFVTAFAFGYGDTRALLLSCDLCLLSERSLEAVWEEIEKETGISRENMLIACTHTHSGPVTHWKMSGEINFTWDILRYAAAKAAKAALENLRPAQMGVGTTESHVGVNRRQIKEDGSVILGQNPYGPYDPQMTVISFREPDGTPIGNLIHYGCHNTGSGKNDEITRDWCGVAIDRLEQQSGGVTAFINGCGGDVGPRLANGRTTGNLQLALELGGQAAVDAVRAWRSIKIWEDAPTLKLIRENVRLPFMKVGTPDEIRAQAAALGDPEKLVGLMRSSYDNLMERAEYIEAGNVPEEYQDLPHTAIAIGPLAFYGIPFEPFSILTLRVKEHSPYPYTLGVGYANGSFSYFPSMDQLIRGGYEVRMFQTMNQIPFAEDAEQHYVTGCLDMLRKLRDQ